MNARKEREAMPISPEPKREQPSTYFVEDRANQDELNRLRAQDQMLTASMGACCQSSLTQPLSSGYSTSAAGLATG
jgi:hypothetical protein